MQIDGRLQRATTFGAKVGDDPVSVPNLLVQKWDTCGTSRGNYLEVVAGPSVGLSDGPPMLAPGAKNPACDFV